MTLGNVKIEQIEQERVDAALLPTADGNLTAFEQNKPLFPAVYEGSSIDWAPAQSSADYEAWKVVLPNENVIDKFVTVKNTGKSDAFVRTLIAYEGDATYGPRGEYIHIVHNSTNVDPDIAVKDEGVFNIKGVDYTVFSYTYPAVLKAGDTTIPSLKQVYLDKTADNDVVAKYGETYDILVLSQAVQTAGFADANTALTTAFPYGTDNANLIAWFADEDFGKDESQAPAGPGEEKPKYAYEYKIDDLGLIICSNEKLKTGSADYDYNARKDGYLEIKTTTPIVLRSKNPSTPVKMGIQVYADGANITLDGVNLESQKSGNTEWNGIYIYGGARAVITVKGNNTITGHDKSASYGISAGSGASLELKGDGTLTISNVDIALNASSFESPASIRVGCSVTVNNSGYIYDGDVLTTEGGSVNGQSIIGSVIV